MNTKLTGAQFADMMVCAASALNANKQAINELNVFPVPDGDTGTNMTMTLSAAAAELGAGEWTRIDKAMEKTASMLLRGARGNSGVILSLFFRGASKSLRGCETATSLELAAALGDGVDAAYKAVMKPAEGTILTVARCATAAAVEYAADETGVEGMLTAAIEAAKAALERTTEQNPVLCRAGVVDAGGMGYIVMLEAMLASLEGRMQAAGVPAADDEEAHGADFGAFDTEEIKFAYDTVYIVRKNGTPLDLYRAYLESIGDSIVISEDDEVFKVHVHTNIPGAALTEAEKYGTLETAKIENMRTQHAELSAARAAEGGSEQPYKNCGCVAVCAGEGLAGLFRELGCDGIVTGGQTMNPSTEDILREINRVRAGNVFVFPNNGNVIMAAQQCARLTDKNVIVIPTVTVPQGVTAMLEYDRDADPVVLEQTFCEAIAGVHTAQITYAARDSEYDGREIKAGEYLGLLDKALVGSCAELDALIAALCTELEALTPEFISVYFGEDVAETDAAAVAESIGAHFPYAEVSLVNGGQPVYYYLISAE